jgi:Flp pilus assembly protein TadG
MMKNFSRRLRRFVRRQESGQSVILLAIGFIALVAFVGITTDVALMFVRYSQLSRAVDAAAIAAANQMRQDRTYANLGIAARQFIELYGLNPVQVLVDTCVSTDKTDIELCGASGERESEKLVRVTAQVESPTAFMRLLGFNNFLLQAQSVSQTATLDVVVIMDVSESMAQYTTVEDWARIGLGVIYLPPRAFNVWQAKFPAFGESEFWEGGPNIPAAQSLLGTWQQRVNNRLYYVDNGTGAVDSSLNHADADAAYVVRFNKTYFEAEHGPQSHPRPECRVRFFPTAYDIAGSNWWGEQDSSGNYMYLINNTNPTTFAASLYPRAGFAWPAANRNFDGFVPNYNFYGCCNDPNGNADFSDLVCQPFKQTRDAIIQFTERIDFDRGDRLGIVTFDRTAYLINPYPYTVGAPECPPGNRNENCRPGAMMQSQDDAETALKKLVGVRAEPNFYRLTSGNVTGNPGDSNIPVTAAWTGFAAGIGPLGQSIALDYSALDDGFGNPTFSISQFQTAANTDGRSVPPHLYNFPVYISCPYMTAGERRADRTLFDFGVQRSSIPNRFQNAAWATYSDPSGARLYRTEFPVTDPQSYNMDMSYDFRTSCRGSNVGAGLREGNNALLNPRTIRTNGTVWVMILLANGAAGGSDPLRRSRETIPAPAPYAWNVSNASFGISGQYGSLGICPYGTPQRPAELTLPGNDSASRAARPPYCANESPRDRQFCNFRPLLSREYQPSLDPIAIYKNPNTGATCGGPGAGCVAVPPIGDVNYVLFDGTEPKWYGTNGPQSQSEELEWNRVRGNLYDVDLTNCAGPNDPPGTDNANYYDADDYARDWADYIAVRTDINDNTLRPSIFTIGFGAEYLNRQSTPGGPVLAMTNENAEELCRLNVNDCLGEQLLRYIADAGDNNKIDNDYYQWLLNPNTTPPSFGSGAGRTADDNGDYGQRDPCQTQEPAPNAANSYDTNNNGILEEGELRAMYGHLAPQTNCGNYYYAPDYTQLQFVFDDIASRMFTRLSR